ncbi:MAG: YceD family protein [Candidatus Obscuribacterales bacterium]|nr:YceD family protein [Candidatus Obscuribacterales bacterium]
MKISIDELRTLPQQRLKLSFKESIEGLGAVKPVLGDLTATANSTGIKLSGTVHTLLKLTCHRCLRPYFLNLNLPIEEFVVESKPQEEDYSRAPREKELTADDFVESLSADGILDISDLVYQAVTLATPVSCLCGEDCPGPAFPDSETKSGTLASGKDHHSGEDRIDPRWKNLKTLFPNEETE